MQITRGYERAHGRREEHDRIRDLLWLTQATHGRRRDILVHSRSAGVVIVEQWGVGVSGGSVSGEMMREGRGEKASTNPGQTALTRMPSFA